MKKRWMLLIMSYLFAIGCAITPVKDDSIFNRSEKNILEKTTEALDYGYGYDHEVELDYIHSHDFSETNLPAREKALAAAMKNYEIKDLLGLYSKLYRLGAMMRLRIKAFEKDREWKQYTYLKNYLLPPLEAFTDHIRKQLLTRDPTVVDLLPAIHNSAEKAAAYYMYELEMEELRDKWRI